MPKIKAKRQRREPWWGVARELSPNRRVVLMVLSFLIPLGVWSGATYLPLFHSEVKFTLTTEKIGTMAAYTPGDRVKKDYFGEYTDLVRGENHKVLADQAAGKTLTSTRSNKKRLRQIRPLAEANGWLEGMDTSSTAAVDPVLFEIYGKLAAGSLQPTVMTLTHENLGIIRENWKLLETVAPYESGNFIKTPLLHLIPQGYSASPVFLPAPHECVLAAWDDFTAEPENNMPWMYERLLSSLKVVFGAFLLAAAIGIPIGLVCGTYDLAARIVEPFVDFFRLHARADLWPASASRLWHLRCPEDCARLYRHVPAHGPHARQYHTLA